ncbi:MAG TPA: hypothetical protein PLO69_13285 [Gammaproteobacteria bacterium]|nr:hypothetical protein [Gammaproteobacteria bacterium]
MPLMQVRDLLRHTSYQVTEKYAHLAPEQVRSAVAVLDQKYASDPREVFQLLGSKTKNASTSRFGHVGPRLRVIRGGKQ